MEYQNQQQQELQNKEFDYPTQTSEDIEMQWQQFQQKEQKKQAFLPNNYENERQFYQMNEQQYNDIYQDHIVKERVNARQCTLRIVFVVAFIIFCITQLVCKCIFT